MREVANGTIPHPFELGRSPHWSKSQIDRTIEQLTGDGGGRINPLDRLLHPAGSQPKAKDEPPAVRKRVYSVETLAEHWQCSDDLVRKLIASGTLRSFKYGNLIRIAPEAVAEFEKIASASKPQQI